METIKIGDYVEVVDFHDRPNAGEALKYKGKRGRIASEDSGATCYHIDFDDGSTWSFFKWRFHKVPLGPRPEIEYSSFPEPFTE